MIEEKPLDPWRVACTHCGAREGVRCHDGYGGRVQRTHAVRKTAAAEKAEEGK